MTTSEGTRPLDLTYVECWVLHEVIAPAFAGWNGRHESAKPWHGETLLAAVRDAITRFDSDSQRTEMLETTVVLDLTEGELIVIADNLPRTAHECAADLLVRVFRALTELKLKLPIHFTHGEAPMSVEERRRLTAYTLPDEFTSPNPDYPV